MPVRWSARRQGGVLVCALLLLLLGCGGNAQSAGPAPALQNPAPPTAFPQVQHVGIVIFENQRYEDVVGSSAMLYLNSLIPQNALATNYFANTHPSLPNYFMVTVGDLVTNTDAFDAKVTADNVVRRLVGSGKTWKAYLDALPSAGYTGDDSGPYVKHHNPFVYFSDVVDDVNQVKNVVPFTQLAADIDSGQLPNYFFIVPDNNHNAHECPVGMTTCTTQVKLRAADQWLKDSIAPLLASPAFQPAGLLVITFDESAQSDVANGGGHIVTLLVGSGVKQGFRSSTFYQHQSVLRLTLEVLGINALPGAAATAPEMREFFP